MLEGVAPSVSDLKTVVGTTPPQPQSQQPSPLKITPMMPPPTLPKPGSPLLEGLTAQTTGSPPLSLLKTTPTTPAPQALLERLTPTPSGLKETVGATLQPQPQPQLQAPPTTVTPRPSTSLLEGVAPSVTSLKAVVEPTPTEHVVTPPSKPGAPLLEGAEGISKTPVSVKPEVPSPPQPQLTPPKPSEPMPGISTVTAPKLEGIAPTTEAVKQAVASAQQSVVQGSTELVPTKPGAPSLEGITPVAKAETTTPPVVTTPIKTPQVAESPTPPAIKPTETLLGGTAPSARSLREAVDIGTIPQPIQQAQPKAQAISATSTEIYPAKPGAPKLEGMTPTVGVLHLPEPQSTTATVQRTSSESKETIVQPPVKPSQAKLEGIAPTIKSLGKAVTTEVVVQPVQQVQTKTQSVSISHAEEVATHPVKPGAPLLEGLTPTVKTKTEEVSPARTSLETTTLERASQLAETTKTPTIKSTRALLEGVAPTVKSLKEAVTSETTPQPSSTPPPTPPPTTDSGEGVVFQHTPGGVVGHGGARRPPPTTGTGGGSGAGGGKPPATGGGADTGGSTPSTDAAIQNTAISMAQGVVSTYKSHGLAYGPGINSAESFLAYMNALKQNNPALYNQLMQNPTIKEAMQYAQAYINYANTVVNWGVNPSPTMTKQQFAVTTANNLITQINQSMQSGNYSQALQYAQQLKDLAQQYNLPIGTQSLNTLINELTILSKLPSTPNPQGPRLSPQLMRALARTEPGFYTSMQNVYYQNAYQQWQAYANQLNQLASQAQSMGLTDLANRLKAQASTANQIAQGYLVNYVLTSPNVQGFISTYNQFMQLLKNQPNPQANPQAYLDWVSQVVAMGQQVSNAWQSVYPFLRQYQGIPQIQQLIQQGQYAQQVVQQVMQYAQQLQPNLLLSPSILNVTPTSLAQGSLGGVLTGSALMQSLAKLPPGTQIQIPDTATTQGQNIPGWEKALGSWYQSQLELARQSARSRNPLEKIGGYGYLGALTLGSSALAGIENLAGSILGGIGVASVGLAEAPLIGTSTITGPRSPLTQFLLGVGVPLAQAGQFLQSSASWINQQNMQAWQGVAPQWEVRLPGWVRPITPLIEAFYPYVKDNKLVVSPGTVIGAIGYNLPIILTGVGVVGGIAKGVGLGMAGEETLASQLTPELSARFGMWLAERAPLLARTLPRLGLTSERLIGLGSSLERVGAVGNLIDPYAWLGKLTGEALVGTGELASRLGGRLERYALSGLARTIPEGTPEFYMLPRYAQYATALRNIGTNLLGAVGTTMERVGGAMQVIGRPLAEAFPMPWEYYTYRQLFGEVGPLGEAVMPYTRPLTQELRGLLKGAGYTPFRYSFPLVIASASGTPARLTEVLGEGAPGALRLGKTVLETGTGTITGIERYGYLIPIAYRLPGGEVTGVALVARVTKDGKYVELTAPAMGEGGLARMRMTVPVSKLDQAVKDIAQRLAIQLQLPPGGEVLYDIQPLYLFRIRTNVPGLPSELTAFLTPQQIRAYRSLVGASIAAAPNELVEMLGLTANANQVEALRNAYYTLLASLLGQPPEVLERNPQLVLGLGSGLATQYMRGLSPTLISDIMARTGRTPASLFYEWFQNVLPYVQKAQRSIITPGVGVFDITASTAPFGRLYMPYAFGMTEVPIGARQLLETMPGSEVVGTGALLRAPGSLVVPGLGGLRRVLGELVTLKADPYALMRLFSKVENELAETGITARPLQALTEVGTPLYTHAGAKASAELMGGWGELLRTAPVSTARAEELGEITTGEYAPYISRLRPEEAETVAESERAVRSLPTGAAGIKALPTTAKIETEAAPPLGKLVGEETEEGAAKYLSALTGLKLAEETASSVTEAVPELLKAGVRALPHTLPTQPPTTLGINIRSVGITTPTVQPPKIEEQLQPITIEAQAIQTPRLQPIQPPPPIERLRLSPTPIGVTAPTKTTEAEVPSIHVPIVSLPTIPTTGAEVTETVTQATPRLQLPSTTTGGRETVASTSTGAGVVAGVLLPTGLTTLPTTQTQQQEGQEQGQGVSGEVGVGEGVGEYLSALTGLGLGGGARVGGVPVVPVPVVVGGGGVATVEEIAREEIKELRGGGRAPITPARGRTNEEPVMGVLPGNLRETAGNLLSFSWHAPGRINVSPPGVLELLRALAPPGQPTTRQYYTQVTPVTITPVEIPPPPLPPITIQETPTTGQGVQSPPTTGAPAPPVPPTAAPPLPPFLIPLLWFPSWMPQPQAVAGVLARPGAMREILVL